MPGASAHPQPCVRSENTHAESPRVVGASNAVPCRLAAKAGDEEIHETSHLRREMPARWIERMLLRRRIIRQQAGQPARAQIIADNEGWDQDDPAARNRRRAKDVGVV